MRLIRLLFRLAATLALVVAVILAVGDAARSVAAGTLRVTPLAQSWAESAPATLDAAELYVETQLGAGIWDQVVLPLLGLPGFALFALLAVLFFAIGRSPAPRRGRIASAA
jgi:hypothetical protein